MGGNALSYPVERIRKENISDTLDLFSHVIGVPVENMVLLGSAGKQKDSGDLDIAIDVNKYDPEIIRARFVGYLREERCIFNKGSNVGSFACPIISNSSFNYSHCVQIDIMFVKSIKWAEFSYFSAGDKSKYKGAIRAILLSAVATEIEDPGNTFSYDLDGSLLMRVGFGIDPNKGLKRMFKMRPLRKNGKGFTKTMKSVTPEEIKETFPRAKFSKKQVLIDDPEKVVAMLFWKGVKPKDVETVEQIQNLLCSSKIYYKSQLIYQRAAERCKPLVGKIKIPWEIERFMK